MLLKFDGKRGHLRLQDGKYRLQNRGDTQLINPQHRPSFTTLFSPGKYVVLKMHFDSAEVVLGCCPRCLTSQETCLDGDTVCETCSFVYTAEDEANLENAPPVSPRPESHVTLPNKESMVSEKDRPEQFKNVSISAKRTTEAPLVVSVSEPLLSALSQEGASQHGAEPDEEQATSPTPEAPEVIENIIGLQGDADANGSTRHAYWPLLYPPGTLADGTSSQVEVHGRNANYKAAPSAHDAFNIDLHGTSSYRLSEDVGLRRDGSNSDDEDGPDDLTSGFNFNNFNFKFPQTLSGGSDLAGPMRTDGSLAVLPLPWGRLDQTFTYDAMNVDSPAMNVDNPRYSAADFPLFSDGPATTGGEDFPSLGSWGHFGGYGANHAPLQSGNSTLEDLFPELKGL